MCQSFDYSEARKVISRLPVPNERIMEIQFGPKIAGELRFMAPGIDSDGDDDMNGQSNMDNGHTRKRIRNVQIQC